MASNSRLADERSQIKIKDESRSFYHELHSACLVKKASYTARYHLFFYANVIPKFYLKRNNSTVKRQKLTLHSLKNKDQCPVTWDNKHYTETQQIPLNYAAKNEKLTSTIAMPISQTIPHFMAFLFKISPISF
ncbi:hypothetical protein [Acinetobacter johnsonii]|uniref:Uncharacterized protein n=1 Tax=Acinetobacter johnsonii TaxID=40214 RepID=A0A7T2RUX7_ACIJO|nr:hypothetical protein [Acinetobacter johnsonii]QPS03684.1 hypothetical protein I6G67_16070 [Acinetobacter johnsonii]